MPIVQFGREEVAKRWTLGADGAWVDPQQQHLASYAPLGAEEAVVVSSGVRLERRGVKGLHRQH